MTDVTVCGRNPIGDRVTKIMAAKSSQAIGLANLLEIIRAM